MNLELWNEELKAEYSEEISTYGVHNKLEDDKKSGMLPPLCHLTPVIKSKQCEEIETVNKKNKNRKNGIVRTLAVILLACTLLTTAGEAGNVQGIVTYGDKMHGEDVQN